jgi:hypothetical protein
VSNKIEDEGAPHDDLGDNDDDGDASNIEKESLPRPRTDLPPDERIIDSGFSVTLHLVKEKVICARSQLWVSILAVVRQSWAFQENCRNIISQLPNQGNQLIQRCMDSISSLTLIQMMREIKWRTVWTNVLHLVRNLLMDVATRLAKLVGILLVLVAMCHKNAFREILENDTARVAYMVSYFLPSLISLLEQQINLPHWSGAVIWYFVLFELLRLHPVGKHSLQNAVRQHDMEAKDKLERNGPSKSKNQEPHLRDKDKLIHAWVEPTILFLRFTLPMCVFLETFTGGSGGILMDASASGRLMRGFALTTLRSGFLWSQVLWISWPIQYLACWYFGESVVLEHFILVFGLASIRFAYMQYTFRLLN